MITEGRKVCDVTGVEIAVGEIDYGNGAAAFRDVAPGIDLNLTILRKRAESNISAVGLRALLTAALGKLAPVGGQQVLKEVPPDTVPPGGEGEPDFSKPDGDSSTGENPKITRPKLRP